jgi:hypothetical protein
MPQIFADKRAHPFMGGIRFIHSICVHLHHLRLKNRASHPRKSAKSAVKHFKFKSLEKRCLILGLTAVKALHPIPDCHAVRKQIQSP